jgi:hypothetical protein
MLGDLVKHKKNGTVGTAIEMRTRLGVDSMMIVVKPNADNHTAETINVVPDEAIFMEDDLKVLERLYYYRDKFHNRRPILTNPLARLLNSSPAHFPS